MGGRCRRHRRRRSCCCTICLPCCCPPTPFCCRLVHLPAAARCTAARDTPRTTATCAARWRWRWCRCAPPLSLHTRRRPGSSRCSYSSGCAAPRACGEWAARLAQYQVCTTLLSEGWCARCAAAATLHCLSCSSGKSTAPHPLYSAGSSSEAAEEEEGKTPSQEHRPPRLPGGPPVHACPVPLCVPAPGRVLWQCSKQCK